MSELTPAERWRRIEAIFTAALDKPAAERDAFIAMACGDDAALHEEIRSLLSAHECTGMVERLAASLAVVGEGARTAVRPLEGRTIGRYVVQERVGGGGMGVVYKAYDAELDRTVALKFLQGHLDGDARAVERFRQEARAVAALEHPNICTVYEIGETADGVRFIAMPLYDGETLQQRVSRGSLPVEVAVTITLQVLRALAKAHARGIIHRDIKPSNVLITSDDVVKLLDFGIAKLTDVTLTGTAGPIGTLAYMSPEQALGATVDARTDLWSVGVMLYEMLAGERPYASGVAAAMTGELRAMKPVSLRTKRNDVPAALDDAVMRALARVPDQRFSSASEFERALVALGMAGAVISGEAPGQAKPLRAEPRRPWLALVIGVAAMLVAAALWKGGDAPATSTPLAGPLRPSPTLAVLPFTDRTTEAGRDFFGDGITEELISTLSRVEGLRVAATTSVFAYKNKQEDVRVIGEKLGVGTVLEGSVQQSGSQLRIYARLVNVADGLQLWTEQYDRPVGDAFEIQSDIARSIAQVMQLKLVGSAADSTGGYRPKPEAYEAYLRAMAMGQRMTTDGSGAIKAANLERIRINREAVRIDPKFAGAWVSIAETHLSMGFNELLPPSELFPEGERAARKAIEADSTYAEAFNALGYVQLYYRWNLAEAEKAFKHVVTLRPRYRIGRQWYANLLTVQGRFPDAVREMQAAQLADSTSVVAIAAEGWVHYLARDYARARLIFERARSRNPDHAGMLHWGSWVYEVMDSLPQAIRDLRRVVKNSNSAPTFVAGLASALARHGDAAEARSLLASIEKLESAGEYVPSYELAKVHLALGERAKAYARLERALADRAHSMVLLRLDPQFDDLRGEPRFAELLRRIERARQ